MIRNFMLNSTEHENFLAHSCFSANYFWHFTQSIKGLSESKNTLNFLIFLYLGAIEISCSAKLSMEKVLQPGLRPAAFSTNGSSTFLSVFLLEQKLL